jgi:hypothetical protein
MSLTMNPTSYVPHHEYTVGQDFKTLVLGNTDRIEHGPANNFYASNNKNVQEIRINLENLV